MGKNREKMLFGGMIFILCGYILKTFLQKSGLNAQESYLRTNLATETPSRERETDKLGSSVQQNSTTSVELPQADTANLPTINSYSEVTVHEEEVKISDCSHDTAGTISNANIYEDTTETIGNEINDNN